jgi:hypothetical protein
MGSDSATRTHNVIRSKLPSAAATPAMECRPVLHEVRADLVYRDLTCVRGNKMPGAKTRTLGRGARAYGIGMSCTFFGTS